jgi:hypothetical protein
MKGLVMGRCAVLAVAFWGITGFAFGAGSSDGVASEASPTKPSLEAAFDSGYWVTRPAGGVITIVGMAGRRANREDAIRLAVLDAARKAALFHGVYAESAAVLNQGAGALDYFSDFDYWLELRRRPEELVDALAFDRERDVLEKNGMVVVRVRYAGVSEVPAYASALDEGVPDWTKRYTAAIPGFLTGVGYSKNKGTVQQTCQASYENALVSLLPQLSTRVDTDAVDASGGRMSRSTIRSEGNLAEVMILETWFDRRVNAVWTLVAARERR